VLFEQHLAKAPAIPIAGITDFVALFLRLRVLKDIACIEAGASRRHLKIKAFVIFCYY
jgi:hypothetical protein